MSSVCVDSWIVVVGTVGHVLVQCMFVPVGCSMLTAVDIAAVVGHIVAVVHIAVVVVHIVAAVMHIVAVVVGLAGFGLVVGLAGFGPVDIGDSWCVYVYSVDLGRSDQVVVVVVCLVLVEMVMSRWLMKWLHLMCH